MTFSIVGYDPESGTWGVAVASKFLAAGAPVMAARAGVGAIATQADANVAYKRLGLVMLASGASADEVVARLVADDDGRAGRQVGVVDAQGRGATYTGPDCLPWAGGRASDGYAAQGNILAGSEVVAAMERRFLDTAGEDLPVRLLGALAAGDAAGGDRRGRQSAALIAVRDGAGYGGGDDVLIDLRVDDHVDPVGELNRLAALHRLLFGVTDLAEHLPLEGTLADEVTRLLADVGQSVNDRGLWAALETWASIENLEERLVTPGLIDPVVLAVLRGDPTGGLHAT